MSCRKWLENDLSVCRQRGIARWIQDCFRLSVRRSWRLTVLEVATCRPGRGGEPSGALNEVALDRALTFAIAADRRTEFMSKAPDHWCHLSGANIGLVRPVKPTENGLIEPFKRRLRDECLDVREFVTLDRVNDILDSFKMLLVRAGGGRWQ
jgi:hypothetical protein